MENILVSIIIPTHNRKELIARAVDSALCQTYKNTEIIVIDDASTDGTSNILSELKKKDSRIITLHSGINLGLAATLNKAIETAKGKYIARLDDDDFWCDKNKIEKQVDFLEKNKDYILAGGGGIKVSKTGEEIIRRVMPENDEDIKKDLLIVNTIIHVSVLFRKDIWAKAGGYDDKFDGLEDWELWLRMGNLGKFYNFPDLFACYIGHETGDLSYFDKIYKNKLERLKINIKLRKKYRNNYPNYKKAILACWAGYIYCFSPFKKNLWPILFKLKVLIKSLLYK